jgi:hypothetical protein
VREVIAEARLGNGAAGGGIDGARLDAGAHGGDGAALRLEHDRKHLLQLGLRLGPRSVGR